MKLFDPLREEMIEINESDKTVKRKKIKNNTFEINKCKIFTFNKAFIKKLNENAQAKAVIKMRDYFNYDFIGSRYAGEEIRREIDKYLSEGYNKIVVDFTGITGITQAFGDEVLGIYIRAYGTKWVRKYLEFKNLHPNVDAVLRFVWNYSKKMKSQEK